MLKQRRKQLVYLESQMCLQEEDHHLLDQPGNIQSRSSSKQSTSSSNKSSREDKALEERIKLAKLITEAEFLEKRQTLKQYAQRLKIDTEVAKSKARVKLLENMREVNGKVDTASAFTVYPLQRVRHQLWKKKFV